MCRMLLAVGKEFKVSKWFESLVLMAKDETKIHEKNGGKLGSFKHGDGWGIAYLEKNRFKMYYSTKPIYKDKLPQRIRKIKTNFLLMHARKQSKGEVKLENTHPFFQKIGEKEFVFCHNGTINELIEIKDSSFQPQGDTDSEKIFCSWLNRIKEREKIEEIMREVLRYKDLKGSNVFLSTKHFSYILSLKSEASNYFTLNIGKGKDFLVVSSEILLHFPELKWNEIRLGSLTKVDHKTLEFETILL